LKSNKSRHRQIGAGIIKENCHKSPKTYIVIDKQGQKMQAVMNQITPEQEAEQILQLKRPLLPIDEYAVQQGISRRAVEEYGWMGIVQIRKHKGKTFVVDVPIGSHSQTSQPDIGGANKLKEAEKAPQPYQSIQNDACLFDVPKAHTSPNRIWKVVSLFSLVFLSIAVFAIFQLNMDRKAQRNQLSQAYAGTQIVYNDLAKAKHYAEITQNELAEAKIKLERLRNELDKSRAQVENARNELAQTRKNFEIIKQRYAKAIDQLNEKIRELTVRLTELAENQ